MLSPKTSRRLSLSVFVSLAASFAAGLVPSGAFAQLYLNDPSITFGIVSVPFINTGPAFSTLEVGTVQSVTSSGGVTIVRFTRPGYSLITELRFEPNFQWFSTGPMSGDSARVFKKAFEMKRDADLRRAMGDPYAPNFRMYVDGVFSWLRYYPYYRANAGTVVRLVNAAPFANIPTYGLVSARLADVPSDGVASTTEFYGTFEIKRDSTQQRTYGLLRYNASFPERGNGPNCNVTAVSVDTAERFIRDAVGNGGAQVIDHCTNADNIRVIHLGSGWYS